MKTANYEASASGYGISGSGSMEEKLQVLNGLSRAQFDLNMKIFRACQRYHNDPGYKQRYWSDIEKWEKRRTQNQSRFVENASETLQKAGTNSQKFAEAIVKKGILAPSKCVDDLSRVLTGDQQNLTTYQQCSEAEQKASKFQSLASVKNQKAATFQKGQTWSGWYVCRQGKTNLDLRITGTSKKGLTAIFDFHYIPGGKKGSFFMSGTYSEKKNKLDLKPGKWIQQPRNYATVPMTAGVYGDNLVGRIPFPGCSQVALTLQK